MGLRSGGYIAEIWVFMSLTAIGGMGGGVSAAMKECSQMWQTTAHSLDAIEFSHKGVSISKRGYKYSKRVRATVAALLPKTI